MYVMILIKCFKLFFF